MKKLLLIILCFISLQSVFAYDALIDGIYYNISQDPKEASVTYGEVEYSGKVTIPESVTFEGKTYEVSEIGSYAFAGCTSLTTISIPNSVTGIGWLAFGVCRSLTTIDIPNSVTSIDSYAFQNCSSLTTIDIPNSVTSIGCYAFQNCSSLTTIPIPNGVTSIESYAFNGCTSLTTIDIPNSVTSIGHDAFSWCPSLTTIDIPNSVTSIGSYAFENCKSLKDVILSENIEILSVSIFENCENLSSITLPKNIFQIGRKSFSGCTALTEIHCQRITAPTLNVTTFDNVRKDECKVYVPSGSLSNYTSAYGWKEFVNILEIEQWEIAITAGLGGSTTINGSSDNSLSVEAGRDVVINMIPDEGYELDKIIVNGEDVTSEVENNIYYIFDIAENKSIEIRFRLPVYLIISHADNGQVKVKVTPDMSQEVILSANPKWEINTVTFNGVDVTSEVSADGVYVTPIISKNAELNVSLQSKIATWINVSSSERLRVMAAGRGKMKIEGGVSGANIDIYTISGSKVKSIECTGETIELSVNENNAYIVKMNDQVVEIQM